MSKPVLAIQLDDYILKIVQGRTTSKGWRLDKFKIENVSGKSEEDLVSLLKDIIHKLNVKKGNIIFVIPRGLVTVRYLQLPTSNPNELKNMVDMQVVRQIPYTKEEMIYDYHIIGLTEEGYTKIFLVIVHKDIVSKYIGILGKAGIEPDSIELDSLAVTGLCKIVNIQDEKPIAILDIDYANTNIVVLQGGVPTFTRAVSIGAMQLGSTKGDKDWMNEWINEINRSLTVFQREQAVSIEKIVVFGDYSGKIIPLMTGKINLPIAGFDLTPYLEGISEITSLNVEGVEVSAAGLLGAIREGVETAVNLMPGEIMGAKISKQRHKSLAMTGLLVVGILGTLGLTVNKKIQDKKVYLSMLESRLKETSPSAKELAVKKERLVLIKKQLSTSGSSLDILRELYSIIPQKTSLNVFIYDDAEGVTIKGASPAMSEVFDLIPKLENSTYFENVKNRYATQRKIKGQELTEFHIDCSVVIPEGQ